MRRRPRHRAKKESKNETKVRRRLDVDRTPNLGSLFPRIKTLKLSLEFLDAHGAKMKEEALTVGPDDPFEPQIVCPGSCGGMGAFALAPKIQETVDLDQLAFEANGKCTTDRYGSVNDPCGFELRCKAELEYQL